MLWLSSWIDRQDAHKAAEDDDNKLDGYFAVCTRSAFADADANDLPTLVRCGQEAIAQSEKFFSPGRQVSFTLSADGRSLAFKSARLAEHSESNQVIARVWEARARRGAVVILGHWNAKPDEYDRLARSLQWLGVTCVILILPYHGSRNIAGRPISDYFLSANLGRTIASIRQAVGDTIDVVDWLAQRGYRRLGVIGASLGSCVAGIAGAHHSPINLTSLLLTAGDFAEVVWTGRATQHIRRNLEVHVGLEGLREAWAVISTETYASKLHRADHHVQMLLASRDTVVLPYLSARFAMNLQSAGVDFSVGTLSCGHYTMGMFPYNVATLAQLARTLRRAGFF